MQFSTLFLKIVHDTGQQLTIDRTDGFLQIIHRTEFVNVNTRFQIPPKEKNHTLKDRGARRRQTRRTQTHGDQQARSPLLLKWPTQKKRMPTTSSPPSAYLLSTTHSKDVRFPWVTLYYRGNYIKKEGKLSCNKVVPAKLKFPQLVTKFPAFYQTQRLITVFTRGLRMSVS